ncbi:LysR family transcriptional regulator, partial [Agrobacterium sp. SHOUNA12C]|nr:LysR family transcriptional regulator [Agrobacterium sp. BETTINA12B]MCJ9760008.1 LysR family transcriptional regulator [Agrobacterium sp. SHOUNA12C]
VRTPLGLPDKVRPLMAGEAGLPPLPKLDLVLHRAEAEASPATERLASIMLQAVRQTVETMPQGRVFADKPDYEVETA